MTRKQRLELNWVGKDERPRLEPRILLEDSSLSYHAPRRVSENDHFDNVLIQGDNLLALKALEQKYRGQVKCIFIDPPYNTGSAFEHYDDGLEHSLWLSMMRDRLELLRDLLRPDGSIWITIDDNEAHYLKVLCDEIFGRSNFVANVIWQKRFAPNSTAQFLSESHDHILVFARDVAVWQRILLPRSERHNKAYKNSDNDPRGPWVSGDLSARIYYSAGTYPVETPSGRIIAGPPKGMYWRVSKPKLLELDRDGRIWWGEAKDNVPRLKRFLSEVMQGIVPQTVWLHDEVGSTQEAKKEVIAVVPDAETVFQTPKPERLLSRVIAIASKPNDLILDSFAGSGTTGAVAHKMGRRWIMVELGEHCQTHIVPRLKKVIDGADPGGVTEVTGWKGGGGFRYYRLAPSLMQKDGFDNWIISPDYDAPMLAEAVCKLMGYVYAPDEVHYWLHGRSSERDFIYVTTASLTHDQLRAISDEVGPERSLQICCKAFRANADAFENLTITKIPQAVLAKCEWGKDDYSLRIADLPQPVATDVEAPEPAGKKPRRAAPKKSQNDLFGAEDDA